MKRFPDVVQNLNNGHQCIFFFDNGYGASVVRHDFSYGHEDGSWELAVIKGTPDAWYICYDTPITNDVEGFLSRDEVDNLLNQIEALK